MAELRQEHHGLHATLQAARRRTGLTRSLEAGRARRAQEREVDEALLAVEVRRQTIAAQRALASAVLVAKGSAYREVQAQASTLWRQAWRCHQVATDVTQRPLERLLAEEAREAALVELTGLVGPVDAQTAMQGERPAWLQSR
jgi:hypothetical protein